jgi:lipopolysaccharide/colanic/teichoic acid biosynthesis glycosyltransferase
MQKREKNLGQMNNAEFTENTGLPRWKRLLDVTAIVVALPLLVPLVVAIGLIIRLASRGPILFKQERVGYRGRRFMCLKFRTMHCGAETATHQGHLQQLMDSNVPMVKMDATGDSRIIPLGRLLRSSGLDELPQLLNVLKGEMSLVGPRPCLGYEAARYLPWQLERFNALPGLTGLWQVSGKNRTTFTRMIQLDIEYSRTKSLALDLKIMLKTAPALFIQMWDNRIQRKALGRPPAAQARMPLRVANR